MKFEYCLPFYHDPGDPSIEYCQDDEQSDYGSLAKRDELDADGEKKEYSRSENVYRPL